MRSVPRFVILFLVLVACGVILPLEAQITGPVINQWTPTADMMTARAAACSALLPDGRVLVAGGTSASGVTNTVELYGTNGSFTAGPPMNSARTGATCTTLLDGTVLVTGGFDGANALASAELFLPDTNTWTSLPGMAIARVGHSATLLPWGAVLIAGGENSGTVEIYRTNGVFFTAGTLSAARQNYAVAALSNRRVLIMGGTDGQSTLASMDVYSADDNSIRPSGQMLAARRNFAAATLLDDTVLITGGYDGNGNILKSTEIFNFATGQSVAGPDLASARAEHQAYALPNNGAVMLVGGTDGSTPLTSSELYPYWAGRFLPGASMHTARRGVAASMLQRGGLVVAGGQNASGFLPGSEAYGFATIGSGKPDYHPGEVASMTGTGWRPGEQVQIKVTTLPADEHNVEFTATATADGNGQISIGGFNIDQSHRNLRFLLTATGSQSIAQSSFTDSATTTSIGVITPASGTGVAPQQLSIPVTVTGGLNLELVQLAIDGVSLPDPQALNGSSPQTLTFNGPNEIVGGGTHSIVATTQPFGANTGSSDTVNNYVVKFPSQVGLNNASFGAAFNTNQIVTATISATTGGTPPTATGTVTFVDTSNGNATLATVNLSSGSATFNCANLLPVFGAAQTTHTVQANYSGDSNFTSSSNTVTCRTAKIAPSFNVTTQGTITAGQGFSVTVTAIPVVGIVTGSSYITGSNVALTTGTGGGSQALVSGTTTFNNVFLSPSSGPQQINVTTFVDPIFLNTGVWTGVTIASVPQTTPIITVTTIPASPIVDGTAVQYKATVSAPAGNNFTPSELLPQGVVFTDGTNTSSTIALDGTGSATYTPPGQQINTHQVTATWTGDNNFTGGSASTTLVVNPGPATHFAVTGTPVGVSIGIPFSFTVTALDQFNRTATGYAGTVRITSSDGAATLPSNAGLVNGVGTFSVTLRTVGSQTVTATDTVTSSITGTSSAIAASNGPTHFVVSAPGAANSGTGITFSVSAQDASGNVTPFYTGTVRFTSSDSTATFPTASSTLTNGAGSFTVILRAGGSQTITATDTVNSALNGTSAGIFVNLPQPINGTVSTSSITLQYYQGTNPSTAAQTVITGSTSPATYSVTSPVPWLAIGNGSGATGGGFTVTPIPTGLTPGLYQTMLTVSFSGGGTATVAVQLQVIAIQLRSTPASLTFTAQQGSTTAQSGSIAMQALGINVAATVSASGGSWLTATGSGTTPFSIQVTVDPTGLTAGTFNGNVVVTSTLASNSPLSIPVTLTITSVTPPPPTISTSAIVNGASMQQGAAAPNTIVSAFGTYPGCTSGAQVTIDGNSTTVFASTPTQINFLIPAGVASETSAKYQISCAGLTSQTATIPIATLAPAIFTAAQSGTGQAAIVNQDGTVDTTSTAGSYIQVYGTGFGAFAAVGADGLAHLVNTVTATIGGVQATVLYAGQAPGYTNGLQQINILIPVNAPTGSAVSLVLTAGGLSTQSGVTIAIQSTK